MKLEIINNEKEFKHRIVDDDGKTGEWAGFKSIARLESKGKFYIAVTDYYREILNTETILEIKNVLTEKVNIEKKGG